MFVCASLRVYVYAWCVVRYEIELLQEHLELEACARCRLHAGADSRHLNNTALMRIPLMSAPLCRRFCRVGAEGRRAAADAPAARGAVAPVVLTARPACRARGSYYLDLHVMPGDATGGFADFGSARTQQAPRSLVPCLVPIPRSRFLLTHISIAKHGNTRCEKTTARCEITRSWRSLTLFPRMSHI